MTVASSGGGKLGIAAVAVVMLVAGSHGKHHGHGVMATLMSSVASVIPSGSSYTPQSWARAFLGAAGYPVTSCNVGAVEAWERQEGNHVHGHDSWHNPANTTYTGPGNSWLYNGKIAATENSAGVRAYDSWHTGLVATVRTLNLPAYSGIRAALAAGNDAQAVADAVGASPWGTGYFTAGC